MKVHKLIRLLQQFDDTADVFIGHSWYNGNEDRIFFNDPVVFTDTDDVYIVAIASNGYQLLNADDDAIVVG